MKRFIPWTEEQRGALQRSIEHWEDICSQANPKDAYLKLGIKQCACCNLYIDPVDENMKNCSGCPIQQTTGRTGCEGTPYQSCCDSLYKAGFHGVDVTWKEAAKAELQFLRDVVTAGGSWQDDEEG